MSIFSPSQNTSSTSPPTEVLQTYYNLMHDANNVVTANPNYLPYSGQIVPDFNQDQLSAFQAAGLAGGVPVPYYNTASGNLSQAANAGQTGNANANSAGQNISNYASSVGASGPQLQQYSAENLQQYLNPYTQNVIDTTMANLNRNDAIQSTNLMGAGIKAGNAFGGDRLGVAQAELGRNQALANGQTIAGLQSAGFTNAQNAFNTNNSQALAGANTALSGMNSGAQLGLQGASLGANMALGAGNANANLGTAAQNSFLAGTNAQLAAGNQQQAQAGAQLQVPYQNYLQSQAYPYQQLSWQAGIDSGLGSASGGTSTTPGPSQFSQIAGLGIAGLGAAGAAGGSAGIAGLAALSDERTKENVEHIGKTFDGQPIYRFNYKGNPTTQLGLIAQEVEHSHPDAVEQHGGLKYVNYNAATEHAARKGHFYSGGRIGYDDGGVVNVTGDDPNNPMVSYSAAQNEENLARSANAEAMKIMGYAQGGTIGNGSGPFASSNAAGMFQPIDFSSPAKPGLGYIPAPGQIRMGGGPPKAQNAASTANPASGLGAAMKSAFPNNSNPLSLGSSIPDAVGPTSVGGAPLNYSGNMSSTSGEAIYADGGFVGGLGALRGYADGGDVLSADDPVRLDPEAMDRWRKSTDFMLGHKDPIVAGDAPDPVAPPALGQAVAGGAPMPQARPAGLGAAPLPPEIASGSSHVPEDGGSSAAMSYAPQGGVSNAPPPSDADLLQRAQAMGAPAPAEKPNPWLGVMQAGLGMAASRNPNWMGAVAEGGLQGVKSYQEAQSEYNKLDEHPIIDHSGPTTRIYYPSTKQWIDTGVPTMSAGQKIAHDDLQKERAERKAREELTPTPLRRDKNGKLEENPDYKLLEKEKVKAGTIDHDENGLPIEGFIDATNKKYFDAQGNPYIPRALRESSSTPAKESDAGVNASKTSSTYNYSKNAPTIEKGMEVPEPTLLGGKSAQSMKTAAEEYLQTGKLPVINARGKSEVAVIQQQYRTAVENYGNAIAASRGISPDMMADIRRFSPQAAKFVLSAQGNQTVALGTAIRHLDSVREYADVWKRERGSNSPLLREAAAKFAKVWGSDAPTNLEAAVRIAAPETIKAIGVAGAGTGGERMDQEKGFQPGASNEQILGAINVAQKFLAGQLPAKEAQANAVYFPHDKFVQMVGPSEYAKLDALRKGDGGTSTGTTTAAPTKTVTQNGHTYTLQPDGSYK